MATSQLAMDIDAGCTSLGQPATAEQIAKYASLLSELGRWSVRINLTAIRSTSDMVALHLLDSLAARPFLKGDTIVDIGTGAGFPGMPLAIAEPQRSFVLLDANARKISFVRHMIGLLGLPNVAAVQCRAEDYAPGHTFDTVLARALAGIPRIIEVGAHLAGEKGVLLALKGRYPADELEQLQLPGARWTWQVDKVDVPGLEQHARHIVTLKRNNL